MFGFNDERILYTISNKVWLVKFMMSSSPQTIDLVNVYLRIQDKSFAAVGFLTIDENDTYFASGNPIGKAGDTSFFEYIRKLTGVGVITADTNSPIHEAKVSFEAVCQDYKNTNNIKKTAKNMGISEEKTRKILITNGLYTSEKYENIKKLLSDGKTLAEISVQLNMSVKQIRAHLPYNQ